MNWMIVVMVRGLSVLIGQDIKVRHQFFPVDGAKRLGVHFLFSYVIYCTVLIMCFWQ